MICHNDSTLYQILSQFITVFPSLSFLDSNSETLPPISLKDYRADFACKNICNKEEKVLWVATKQKIDITKQCLKQLYVFKKEILSMSTNPNYIAKIIVNVMSKNQKYSVMPSSLIEIYNENKCLRFCKDYFDVEEYVLKWLDKYSKYSDSDKIEFSLIKILDDCGLRLMLQNILDNFINMKLDSNNRKRLLSKINNVVITHINNLIVKNINNINRNTEILKRSTLR